MGIEIERKFLVNKEAWNKVKGDGLLYQQGYLLHDDDKTVRIRLVNGDKGYLTIKGKEVGFSRPEYEYPIPAQDANELLQGFCNAIVVKKRYQVTEGSKHWEVDEFLEDNEGLIIAELELSREDETFDLPGWIDREVTGDPRYYNSQLSIHPFKHFR